MNKFTVLIFSIFVGLIIGSCGNSSKFEFTQTFKSETWQKFDTIRFNASISDTKNEYHILIGLKYSALAAPTNLPIGLTMISPSGSERISEKKLWLKTLEGEPKGIKTEQAYHLEVPLHKQVYFNEEGEYEFIIDNQSDNYNTNGLIHIELKILPGKYQEKKP